MSDPGIIKAKELANNMPLAKYAMRTNCQRSVTAVVSLGLLLLALGGLYEHVSGESIIDILGLRNLFGFLLGATTAGVFALVAWRWHK